MNFSAPNCKLELYVEHLELASFLYEQRCGWLDDPELPWPNLQDLDTRLEAHIDALVLGGDGALEWCLDRATTGCDLGQLHTIVRVLARHARWDDFVKVLDVVKLAVSDVREALAGALEQELPVGWTQRLTQELLGHDAPRIALAARALSYRRAPIGEALASALQHTRSDTELDVLRAMSRVRVPDGASGALVAIAADSSRPAAHRAAAAFSILRGDPNASGRFWDATLSRVSGPDLEWAALPLVIAGDARATPVLQSLIESDASPVIIAALGLHGDLALWDSLVAALARESVAAAAAAALALLSGAEKSADPDVWRAWAKSHAAEFKSGMRRRLGAPCTPATVLATVQSDRWARSIRGLAALELSIRYGVEWPFETDAPARTQIAVCAAEAQRQRADAQRFTAGRWYRSGQLLK